MCGSWRVLELRSNNLQLWKRKLQDVHELRDAVGVYHWELRVSNKGSVRCACLGMVTCTVSEKTKRRAVYYIPVGNSELGERWSVKFGGVIIKLAPLQTVSFCEPARPNMLWKKWKRIFHKYRKYLNHEEMYATVSKYDSQNKQFT